jgi:hypothetical protein
MFMSSLNNYPEACAGILEQSMGTRNQAGKGLTYRPRQATKAGEIDAMESIPGLRECLKIPPLL